MPEEFDRGTLRRGSYLVQDQAPAKLSPYRVLSAQNTIASVNITGLKKALRPYFFVPFI